MFDRDAYENSPKRVAWKKAYWAKKNKNPQRIAQKAAYAKTKEAKEKVKLQRQNPEIRKKLQAYRKKYQPLYKAQNRDKFTTYQRNRVARLKGAEGTFTVEEWQEVKKRFNYTCPKCGDKEPEIVLTQDHIKPLSMGGENYISNIQPLCGFCNSTKRIAEVKYKPFGV